MKTTTERKELINQQELLAIWQGNRSLTRKVIEKFPEKKLFEFSIGNIRPFALMIAELLCLDAPIIKSIAENTQTSRDQSQRLKKRC